MLLVDEIAEVEDAEVSDIVVFGGVIVPHFQSDCGGVDVQNLSCQHHATTRLDANNGSLQHGQIVSQVASKNS